MKTVFDLLIVLILLLARSAVAADAAAQEEFLKAIAAHDEAKVRTMLGSDPSLANAHSKKGASAVLRALLVNDKGFVPADKNTMLPIVLAAHPTLDFYDAVAIGDIAQVRTMLKDDPKLARSAHPFGWTALHIASFAGRLDIMRLLLDAGADVNSHGASKFRNAPLSVAMLTGRCEAAKLLLDHGADPLTRQAGGFTPLQEAALIGRMDCVNLLLDRGSEINSRSDDGRTALSEALRGKHEDVAEFLRSKGAVMGQFKTDLTASPD